MNYQNIEPLSIDSSPALSETFDTEEYIHNMNNTQEEFQGKLNKKYL